MRYITPFRRMWWWNTRFSYMIIIANFIIWLIIAIGHKLAGFSFQWVIFNYLAISPEITFQKLYLWTLITYAFVHFDLMHFFFNMLILLFFGPRVERDMGSQKFLIFYLVCAIGGALGSILAKTMTNYTSPTIGASGAVLGVLLAYGTMYPRDLIYIWGILPMRAWMLVVGVAVLQFLMVFQHGMRSTTDYWAHIGGLAFGFVFLQIENYRRRKPPSHKIRTINWRGEDKGSERTYYLEE